MIKIKSVKFKQTIESFHTLLNSLSDRGLLNEITVQRGELIFGRPEGVDDYSLVWTFWTRDRANYKRENDLICAKNTYFDIGDERYEVNRVEMEKYDSEIQRVRWEGIKRGKSIQVKAYESPPGIVTVVFWYLNKVDDVSNIDPLLNRLMELIIVEASGTEDVGRSNMERKISEDTVVSDEDVKDSVHPAKSTSIQQQEGAKGKQGPRKYSEQEKLDAVIAWEKLDRNSNPITLEEFLEERFGYGAGGVLNVARSTFYGWRNKAKKAGLISD